MIGDVMSRWRILYRDNWTYIMTGGLCIATVGPLSRRESSVSRRSDLYCDGRALYHDSQISIVIGGLCIATVTPLSR